LTAQLCEPIIQSEEAPIPACTELWGLQGPIGIHHLYRPLFFLLDRPENRKRKMNLEAIERELMAIDEFNIRAFGQPDMGRGDLIGLIIRQARKEELRKLALAIAEKN